MSDQQGKETVAGAETRGEGLMAAALGALMKNESRKERRVEEEEDCSKEVESDNCQVNEEGICYEDETIKVMVQPARRQTSDKFNLVVRIPIFFSAHRRVIIFPLSLGGNVSSTSDS